MTQTDEVKAYMEELGFEFNDNKYYKCFTMNEGTCEVTLDGAKTMYNASKASTRKVLDRVETMINSTHQSWPISDQLLSEQRQALQAIRQERGL